jgi:Carbamoyltransferase C-terminus
MVRRAGFWAWWKASGRRLAELRARVVLTICYVLVVPPFAVLVRLTSDPLAIKPKSLRGEPIVNTPSEAFDTFHRSGMDMLVLGDCVVEKPAAR